jgi:archaellum biogenesis protein FlaJ (TadC family)
MKILYIIGGIVAFLVALVYMIIRIINKIFEDYEEK